MKKFNLGSVFVSLLISSSACAYPGIIEGNGLIGGEDLLVPAIDTTIDGRLDTTLDTTLDTDLDTTLDTSFYMSDWVTGRRIGKKRLNVNYTACFYNTPIGKIRVVTADSYCPSRIEYNRFTGNWRN